MNGCSCFSLVFRVEILEVGTMGTDDGREIMHQALAPESATPATPSIDASPTIANAGLASVRRQILERDPEFCHLGQAEPAANQAGLRDYIVAAEDQPHDPDQIFARLRWGGQFMYVSKDRREVQAMPERFAARGFGVVRGPGFVRMGWGIPLLSRKAHYFIARKTLLVPPREFSDRFTYQVDLEHVDQAASDGSPDNATDHWLVRKQVPTFERVLARLQFKAPDLQRSILERRAKKFVEQIFPLFLTREAAMLRIIERDCPREYVHHFPRLVRIEKDSKGYVQRLWTTWLRNGGKPLPQIEFARQSAELLHVLHDRIGIIHLDLRMDNMVVTERGVGFVDFGSAVRVNENIHGNAVLSTLFGELMRTSQIQRMMDRMSAAGALTSTVIRDAYQQVDKSVDVFYLAVQISQPTANPDLRGLIRYDKTSPQAAELSRLTTQILRPANPNHPRYRTAGDVLDAIRNIESRLATGQPAPVAVQPEAIPQAQEMERPQPVVQPRRVEQPQPPARPKPAAPSNTVAPSKPAVPARPAVYSRPLVHSKPVVHINPPEPSSKEPLQPAEPAASAEPSKPKVYIWR
jgi:hypothetical protein